MSIQYVNDDIFKHIPMKFEKIITVVPHVMNNLGGWGAGFTKAISKHYPQVEFSWRQWWKFEEKPQLGDVQMVQPKDNLYFYNMVCQESYRSLTNTRPLNYEYLYQCLERTGKSICHNGIKTGKQPEVHTVKFGSDLAGGNWEIIETMIKCAWGNLDFPVTIYYL